jgi:hypothetical protein
MLDVGMLGGFDVVMRCAERLCCSIGVEVDDLYKGYLQGIVLVKLGAR